MVRANGDALVMHVGEKPIVVARSRSIDLSSHGLNLSAMIGMLGQLLPADAQASLAGCRGAPLPSRGTDHFTVVAARGGDDIWIEIRRRRQDAARQAEVPIAAGLRTNRDVSLKPTPEPEALAEGVPLGQSEAAVESEPLDWAEVVSEAQPDGEAAPDVAEPDEEARFELDARSDVDVPHSEAARETAQPSVEANVGGDSALRRVRSNRGGGARRGQAGGPTAHRTRPEPLAIRERDDRGSHRIAAGGGSRRTRDT
jgi:hypothetical protein